MTADKLAGERIRNARIDHGWTHEDMAREIFSTLGAQYTTSARTIDRVERGHRPSVRKQFAIAKVLEMRPSELWGGVAAPRRALVAA
jgi:transcriptional regulator with XRE-family HTH domain